MKYSCKQTQTSGALCVREQNGVTHHPDMVYQPPLRSPSDPTQRYIIHLKCLFNSRTPPRPSDSKTQLLVSKIQDAPASSPTPQAMRQSICQHLLLIHCPPLPRARQRSPISCFHASPFHSALSVAWVPHPRLIRSRPHPVRPGSQRRLPCFYPARWKWVRLPRALPSSTQEDKKTNRERVNGRAARRADSTGSVFTRERQCCLLNLLTQER